jgi:hypothetical protein
VPLTRRLLLGAGLVALSAGAGTVVGASRSSKPRLRHVPPPQLLVDAADRERVLIATIDAAITADSTKSASLAPLRADHEAHLAALQALVERAVTPSPPSPSGSPSVAGTDVLAALRAAQASGASASASATGGLAALLASISACEAGQAVLLT